MVRRNHSAVWGYQPRLKDKRDISYSDFFIIKVTSTVVLFVIILILNNTVLSLQ
jgi:uncharacterized membrane protein YdfJ with MMPL/SSD domain